MPDQFIRHALLILGHGSSLNQTASKSTREAALWIEKQGVFASVHIAFWKENPGFHEVLQEIEESEVYVVPNFISEGFFTKEVIPREFGLSGKTTAKGRHTIHYCDPLGLHPAMTELLINRAEKATTRPAHEVTVLLIGHGTERNSNSSHAIEDQVQKIRQSPTQFAEVSAAYLDEAPFLSEWEPGTSSTHIVVVPFFISDGSHTREDIPRVLDSKKTDSNSIVCTPPVGIDPKIPTMIMDQAVKFRSA